MKFLDKIKDLFSDEEEVIETKEIEVEENEDHQLPTFMRNKIEEEEKQKEEKKKRDNPVVREEVISDREIVRTRTNSNFSFPIDLDDSDLSDNNIHSGQNVLHKEKKVSDLYSKKEDPKPKKFKPTPVISPVYGILDKNYTKDEVKVQDINSYEIQRPSRKIDFETVRNKAFGNLTDDIKNNLCENCELYQEVKITKNADKRRADDNLLSDMTEEDDISLGTAEENYFDFGVSYEPPKKEQKMDSTTTNIDELEINNNIKNTSAIINVLIISFLFCFRFIDNCSFITSNFSDITCKSFFSFSLMFSPRISLTGVSKIVDIVINISASGTDKPDSHFEIVCLTTFNLILNSSWESPFCFLNAFKLSFNI